MEYIGSELEVFAGALNWKSYLAALMAPFIHGRVLEAGAGIGTNIPLLCNDRVNERLALEPDASLAAEIKARVEQRTLPAAVQVTTGTTSDLPDRALFDTILYVDVLEHIRNDGDEVARAAGHLAPGGHLIILSPAHQFLFSPFDKAVGHERRYNRRSLEALTPATCHIVSARMLDSMGLLLSLGNRVVTRSATPTAAQIALWDRCFVPVSRGLDAVLGYRVGKSILLVWQKTMPSG